MALDHRVIVKSPSPGVAPEPDEFGQVFTEPDVEHRVWATIRDGRASSVSPAGTTTQELGIRSFTIRWLAELAALAPTGLSVIDDVGTKWTVKGLDVNSSTRGRRRYLTLDCERSIK